MKCEFYSYRDGQVVRHTLVVGQTPVQRILQRVWDVMDRLAKTIDDFVRVLP